MTWDVFIGIAKDVLTLTALAAATYSGIEFVRGIRARREAARASTVDGWRKVSVQQIVANSEPFLTVEEITNKLRSQSFEAPFDIKKQELTTDSVRALLIDLVRDGVLGQYFPDRYGITQLPRDVTLPAAIAGVRGSLAVRQAFALILEHPGRYSDDELLQKIGTDHGLSLSDFILAMSDLEARNIATRSPDGKWVSVTNQIGKN